MNNFVSYQIFGLIKGQRIAMLVDCSDANFGFGRVSGFQDSLLVREAKITWFNFGDKVHTF